MNNEGRIGKMDREGVNRTPPRSMVWDPKGWAGGGVGDTMNYERGVSRCVYHPIRSITAILVKGFRIFESYSVRWSAFPEKLVFATPIFSGKVLANTLHARRGVRVGPVGFSFDRLIPKNHRLVGISSFFLACSLIFATISGFSDMALD